MFEAGFTPGFMVGFVVDNDLWFGRSVVVSFGFVYVQINIGG